MQTIQAKLRRDVYQPLRNLMSQCELNYALMMRLLPSECDEGVFSFKIHYSDGSIEQVNLKLVLQGPYTLDVHISQQSVLGDWVDAPKMHIRLYHDAVMAELLSYQGHQRIKFRYEYPLDVIYQRDEKLQLSTFLGEWLHHCLSYGVQSEWQLQLSS